MLFKSGIAMEEDLKEVLPSEARMQNGAVAVFECFQEIPCNPCESSCFRGAVEIGDDINKIPKVNHEVCNGCTSCMSACPGLAIFVVDKKGDKGKLTIPYEFSPLPKIGEYVLGLNRAGEIVAECEVVKVKNDKRLDKTALITLEMEKEMVNDIRFIKLRGEENG